MDTQTFYVVKTSHGYVSPNDLTADKGRALQFATLRRATEFAEAYLIPATVELMQRPFLSAYPR